MSENSGEKRESRPTNTDMTSERTQSHVADRLDRATFASLIDGRLTGADRNAALSKLATSPEDLEILADVVAVSRELDGDVTDIETFAERKRRRRPIVKWASMAAAAAIAVASIPMLRGDRVPAPDGFASMVSLKGTLGPGWDAHSWAATRGADNDISERARGIRTGVLTSTFDFAAAHGDSTLTDLATKIASLLTDVPGASDVVSQYRALAAIHGAISSDQLRKARVAAREMVSKTAFDQGAWLEAARLAAVAHDSAFFASKVSRRQLSELETSADARTRDDVVAVGHLIDKGDWDGLAVATTNIIALLATP
jgi:hypothetical protein